MLLETLGRLRSTKTPSPLPGASQEHISEAEDNTRNSVQSTGTSSVTSSPNARSKRYSNNLFGSGRLRDYTYLKSVASSKASISSHRTVSLTPTEASSPALRPATPEDSKLSSSVQSTPDDSGIRPAPSVPPAPFGDNSHAISVAEYRLQKALGPAMLKRASMALEEAIKELEDEVEDEILLPRSVPIPRGNLDQPASEVVVRYACIIFVYSLLMSLYHRSKETAMLPTMWSCTRLQWLYPSTRLSTTSSMNVDNRPFQHAPSQATYLGCLGQ